MNSINEEILENVNGGKFGYTKPRFSLNLEDVIDFFSPKNAFEYKPDFMPEPYDFNRIYGM